MDTPHPACAGLDVHKDTVVACVRRADAKGKARPQTRTFGTMTAQLLQLAGWLAAQGVTHVAMESTGVYWKPLWNLLEGRFQLLLVNAQHIKHVPGRKTDVKDTALTPFPPHFLLALHPRLAETEDRRALRAAARGKRAR